jgi:hypothetical protein
LPGYNREINPLSVAIQAISALQRIGLVILIALAFLFGLGATVYLSLRSPEVTVPNVVGKDRFEAEQILETSDLNFRVRATRPSNQVKADTVLFQLPRAGEVVKAGQTVAMDISRTAKEGEASEAVVNGKKASEEKAAENRNTNLSANDNENRPRRSKNTNKNANENANANAESRNSNVNRARTNANTTNSNANVTGANRNANSSRNANQSENSRPLAPRPSPPAVKTPEVRNPRFQ